MIRRDYHHFKLHEALQDVETLIGEVRTSGKSEDAEFIVGHGIIRNELTMLLANYGFTPTIQLRNSGVILCMIE